MSGTILKSPGAYFEIVNAAATVFAKEGFRNTDVQVIADLAKVGKGTVYRHFGNKEQLFVATAQFCIEQLGEYVGRQLDDHLTVESFLAVNSATKLLRRIARSCAMFYQKNPRFLEIMVLERVEFRETENPLQAVFRENARAGLDRIIEIAMTKGEFRCGAVSTMSDAFGDLLFGSLIKGCFDGARNDLVERVELAIDLLLKGIVSNTALSSHEGAEISIVND